ARLRRPKDGSGPSPALRRHPHGACRWKAIRDALTSGGRRCRRRSQAPFRVARGKRTSAVTAIRGVTSFPLTLPGHSPIPPCGIFRAGPRPPQAHAGDGLAVNALILAYWRWAEKNYLDAEGKPTRELENLKDALRPLRKLYGDTEAAK